jgi:hypothetical protein
VSKETISIDFSLLSTGISDQLSTVHCSGPSLADQILFCTTTGSQGYAVDHGNERSHADVVNSHEHERSTRYKYRSPKVTGANRSVALFVIRRDKWNSLLTHNSFKSTKCVVHSIFYSVSTLVIFHASSAPSNVCITAKDASLRFSSTGASH